MRDFSGRYLSEPKQNAVFVAPRRPLSRAAFQRQAAAGARARPARAPPTFSGRMFYMNGEAERVPGAAGGPLRRLADDRKLAGPLRLAGPDWDVQRWYLQGFVHAGGKA